MTRSWFLLGALLVAASLLVLYRPAPVRRAIDEEEASPASLRELGKRHLAARRYREALLTFESLSLQPAAQAEALSDLAAAYLERGEAERRPFDSILALSAANRALAIRPELADALHNRAEALSRLQLAHRATAAWEGYLQMAPRGAGAPLARDRLRELAEPTWDELWQQQQTRLERALTSHDRATVREIVFALPHRSRLYAEETLLGEWAAGGPPAGRADRLIAARAIGEALRERTGDAMLVDAVAAIERARDRGDGDAGALQALLAGHRDFARAVVLYRSQDMQGAYPLMLAAERSLAAAGSPFAGWPALDADVCVLYGSALKALPLLKPLRLSYDPQRYPELTARIDWALGMAENNLDHPERALEHYRTTFERLDATVGTQASGFVHVLLGEAYQTLGQLDRAWDERLLGLAASRRQGDRQRIQASLFDAADRLLDQDLPNAALDFAEELLLNATAYGEPGALAEARLQRARSLAALGRHDEALEDLRAATDHTAAMPAGVVSERIRSMIAMAEGEELAERDPVTAVQRLTAALSIRLDQGYRYRLQPLLTYRARAYRKLGDLPRAESDLQLAIEGQERTRSEVRDLDLRLSTFRQAQAAFDDMVRLQIDAERNAAKALEYADRARSRLLRDLAAGSRAARPAVPTVPAVLARLPAGTALVEYLVLPERLVVWIARSGSLRTLQVNVREPALDRSVRALRTAIERRAPAAQTRNAAGSLYETLIRPLTAELSGVDDLIVVADRSLVQVPFAALFDVRRGRYLIEDHNVTLAPSAALYLTALDRLSQISGEAPRDALVVGDPAFDSDLYPHLSRLPAAAAEAAEIASLYEQRELLVDDAATREAFLASAPRHRIVHFAGHALLQPLSPGLSMLLFAPGPGDRGPLYARDLTGYRLAETEMVVLSACRTLDDAAASRESLVGLAAAFLAAGPPVVVSSLWKVDDDATRDLMVAFHRSFRQGASPAAALRAAQLALLHGASRRPERFRSPTYWAGFEAFGAGNRRSGPSPSP